MGSCVKLSVFKDHVNTASIINSNSITDNGNIYNIIYI